VSGEFAIYYYAWRGGPRLIGKPGFPEFMRSYNEAVASRRLPAQGKLFTLIAEFRASSEYSSLSDATERAYVAYLRMIEAEFGNGETRARAGHCRPAFGRGRQQQEAAEQLGDEANTPTIGAGTPVLVLVEQWIPHYRSLTVLFQHVIESLDCDGLQRCIPFQGQHSQRL
jgi:hypothetical protein